MDKNRNRNGSHDDRCFRPRAGRGGGAESSPRSFSAKSPDSHNFAAPPQRPEAPPIPEGAPAVHLKSVRHGAFVYQRMVDRVEGSPDDGDIVAVADRGGRLFGWAFWHSRSQIALRMISRAGPAPDDALLAARVRQAVALRHDVLKLPRTTDAYRLIHAEGDGLPGLVADRFGDYVVIELFSLAMFRRLERIEDALIDAGLRVRQIVVRADKRICQQEGFQLGQRAARKDLPVEVAENGVRFLVHAGGGHKTGFFCDQRDNRLALCELTPARRVLDVCCYTGGFSCYAAGRGGAASVEAVDLDETAIADAQVNAGLNAAGAKPTFQHADAFDFLRSAAQQGRAWDVVVLDPSKFVPSRAMMDVGLRKYLDLNRLGASAVTRGGLLLTCCCSGLVDHATFLDTVGRAVRQAGRVAQIFRVTGPGGDHPVLTDAPEGDYLKAVWARVW
jgi:23S rRNA (cytosine1962-C5)-methyltransferase